MTERRFAGRNVLAKVLVLLCASFALSCGHAGRPFYAMFSGTVKDGTLMLGVTTDGPFRIEIFTRRRGDSPEHLVAKNIDEWPISFRVNMESKSVFLTDVQSGGKVLVFRMSEAVIEPMNPRLLKIGDLVVKNAVQWRIGVVVSPKRDGNTREDLVLRVRLLDR